MNITWGFQGVFGPLSFNILVSIAAAAALVVLLRLLKRLPPLL